MVLNFQLQGKKHVHGLTGHYLDDCRVGHQREGERGAKLVP